MATSSQPVNSAHEKLSVALLNINGLRNKMDEIQNIIKCYKLHVVGLCETKLDDSVEPSRVYIPGFRMWRRDRDSSGGGVALYVQDHIKTRLRPDLMKAEADEENPEAEIIWVEMKLPDSRPVLLGSCYRPTDNLKHLVQIYDTMDLVLKEKEEKDILLMGDFNTDWYSDPEKNVAEYVSSKWGLNQIVQDKTRITQKSSSCIDLIYTNIPVHSGRKAESTATGCSDHNLVTVKLSRNVPQKIISFRFKQIDGTFWKVIDETQWTEVYNESDPAEALKKFTDIFLSVANRHLKNQDIYDLLKLDDKIERLITERDDSKHLTQEELKKKHAKKSSGSDSSKADDSAKGKGVKCFQCKPKLNLKLKSECKNCKGLTQYCKIRNKEERNRFMQHREKAVNFSKILKICKQYFGESLPSHVINITQQGDVTSDLYYLREEKIFGNFLVETMTDEADKLVFCPNQILNEWLESLLSTDLKDADIHKIDAELLNGSSGSISGPIRHILNRCLENDLFPSELKQFELIPFSTQKLTKFRENIDLLHSVHVMIGYIFDIILYKQAEKYFIDRKLIASESIDDQIKNLKTDWLKATKSGETVSVLFLDFSSSFDSISHKDLITKLETSGFSDSALKLIKSFLSYHEGSCGLPRGSFFARLLFTVFINELKKDLRSSSVVICQNHMIVYIKDRKMSKKSKKQSVEEWAKRYMIHMNISTDFTITRHTEITSYFELLQFLLNCNQFNVQVLRKVMERYTDSGQEKFKKTFEVFQKEFGSKKCCKVSDGDINAALISVVLL
ncbi:uncharacterized protein LOC122825625 [Gambusia affinis]|uniref:uncharacterized protein LOC122825625 n=1 Tax=Gambusia affinis TaxID=33528 RepID=UPI001CDBFE45|nr:uncharacterized protein LOC122825625 [Gambusia affinis]